MSFSATRRLGIGFLLLIALLGAVFTVVSLHRVVMEIQRKVEIQEQKERHFAQMALRFAMLGSDFYRHWQNHTLRQELPALGQHLNTIRSILTQLGALPLSTAEYEGVMRLRAEEARFRKALDAFAGSGAHPAGETATSAMADIDALIEDAVDRATYYTYRTSELIEATNREILRSTQNSAWTLTVAVVVTAFAGLAVSVLLGRVFSRHLAPVLRATRELGQGNLSYRVNTPYRDPMGQLAQSIDEMGTRLEAAERRQQATLAELREAKDVSDAQSRELAARAVELDRSRTIAEAASRSKSQFLASMSHELRTPLNGVLGMTELLLGTDLTPKQRRFGHMARQSGELLLGIINDILDISRIEAGKLELERARFDPRALVEETVGLFAERAQHQGLELACSVHAAVPSAAMGDGLRLQQVLMNLLNNAIKFTPRGEVVIRVTVADARADDVLLRVEVRDTGIGIPLEHQTRIFESFTQADGSTTRRFGGTGLGLTIARQLVEMMNGGMGLESVPGQGATFWFTVRLGLVADALPTRRPAAHLRGVRVLIVDDNATNLEILIGYCTAWGMECSGTGRAADALSLLRDAASRGAAFEVVLSDFHMPEIDGLALARAVKGDPSLARTSFLLLTSIDGVGEEASRSGVAQSLTKPVRANQLHQTLMTVVGGASEEADPAGARRVNSVTALSSLSGRVLLAEDNPVNQEVAASMLDRLGCQATAVATGAEAVAALERETYDLVLMDVQMPQMDGLTATRLIRNREARTGSGRIPIVALTANAFTRDAEACIAAGMDDYLSKPFTLGQLHAVLARRLSRALVGAAPFDQGESAAPVADNGHGRRVPAPLPREAVLDRRPLDALRALQRPDRPNVLQKVLDAFWESSSRLVTAMEAGLSRGDAQAVHQAAHSLKSSSANIGATTLSAHCREIETLGRANALADAVAVFERLRAEHALVEAALKRELETDRGDSEASLQAGRA